MKDNENLPDSQHYTSVNNIIGTFGTSAQAGQITNKFCLNPEGVGPTYTPHLLCAFVYYGYQMYQICKAKAGGV